MLIQPFMDNYKKAWETSDEHLLASLFTEDGRYHNTPFAVQTGHAQIKQYWQRTKLQADILLTRIIRSTAKDNLLVALAERAGDIQGDLVL